MAGALSGALTGAAITSQVLYPLLRGEQRRRLTIPSATGGGPGRQRAVGLTASGARSLVRRLGREPSISHPARGASGHTMVTDAGQLGATSRASADVRETSALLNGLSGIRRHGAARPGPVF